MVPTFVTDIRLLLDRLFRSVWSSAIWVELEGVGVFRCKIMSDSSLSEQAVMFVAYLVLMLVEADLSPSMAPIISALKTSAI